MQQVRWRKCPYQTRRDPEATAFRVAAGQHLPTGSGVDPSTSTFKPVDCGLLATAQVKNPWLARCPVWLHVLLQCPDSGKTALQDAVLALTLGHALAHPKALAHRLMLPAAPCSGRTLYLIHSGPSHSLANTLLWHQQA